ncbi:MAG TPA: asparagine synthase (glutamine-hydrolyzing) [Bryobacteraceae bacterium]|nr:asparagine synthase (glutamine-hydrolyzing) [Bryobacteraceae bacterium]
MCGIAGVYLPGRMASEPLVRAMCDPIVHRGPDDEGIYTDGGCGIGMRRLSIIDLATGHQPISNEDGTIWTVFNGEIYNYRELRDDLACRGHRLATQSDTEALVHLYEEYGIDGLSRLSGMFAYAIWDSRKRQLLLVRDRFGKKPLYFTVTKDGLYFGSELKCLRAADVPLDLDPEALKLYLQFNYVPDPHSIFRQVRKVSPGGWALFSETGQLTEGRYWSLPAPSDDPPTGMTEKQAQEQIRDLFDDSVRARMIADVPLGAFLSGGIDSSAVVASMALQSSAPVKTFSIGFEEAAFNELDHAAAVATKYRTDHHTLMVRPDSVELIGKLVRHFDEPFGDSSAIPTYLVSKFAAEHVKVVLTGDGGDEIFAGYQSFFEVESLRKWDALPQAARRTITWVADSLPYSAYGKNFLHGIGRRTPLERYFEFVYAPVSLTRALFQPQWVMPLDEAEIRRSFNGCLLSNGADVLSQAFYFEATAKLTGDMLVKVDRMSMANSLEVRCPLLDHRLAEFAARIPARWKMRNGQGKVCFTESMRDRLPETVWNRRKQGFSVPLSQWFRGPLRSFLRDHLTSPEFFSRGLVSPKFVQYLLDEHDSGRRDNKTWLWRLLMIELWFREWKNAAVPCL